MTSSRNRSNRSLPSVDDDRHFPTSPALLFFPFEHTITHHRLDSYSAHAAILPLSPSATRTTIQADLSKCRLHTYTNTRSRPQRISHHQHKMSSRHSTPSITKWLQLKVYQVEVTFSVYMFTPLEKFTFCMFPPPPSSPPRSGLRPS